MKPSRFARLKLRDARLVAALIGGLLLLSLTALTSHGPPPVPRDAQGRIATVEDRTDILFYENVVAGLRGGGAYYPVAADAQRAANYPMRPFITMRLPTLAVVEAAMPDWVSRIALRALLAFVFLAWAARLRSFFTRTAPWIVALVLLAGGLLLFTRTDLVAFHEIWAGLLIALSLALWRQERWSTAVALGLSAMLIRETAALYAVVMLGAAWRQGRRDEATGWFVALSILAVILAAHAYAWSHVVRADDMTGPGWLGLLGFGFVAKVFASLTALDPLPLAIAAPLVALAIIGWIAVDSPLGQRIAAVLGAYMVLLAVFARIDTYYWAMLTVPLLLPGLAFVPDALRDLWRGASGQRRITVTRIRSGARQESRS